MSGLEEEETGEIDGGEESESVGDESGELAEEYGDALEEDDLSGFEEGDEDLKVVDEALSHKDQGARALSIRRAIEERLEAKRLSKDLDYLDLELDD